MTQIQSNDTATLDLETFRDDFTSFVISQTNMIMIDDSSDDQWDHYYACFADGDSFEQILDVLMKQAYPEGF